MAIPNEKCFGPQLWTPVLGRLINRPWTLENIFAQAVGPECGASFSGDRLIPIIPLTQLSFLISLQGRGLRKEWQKRRDRTGRKALPTSADPLSLDIFAM